MSLMATAFRPGSWGWLARPGAADGARYGQALAHRNGRGLGNAVRVLQAALEGADVGAGQAKLGDDSVDGVFDREAFAGEDVDPDVAAVWEGVDGDVALGDEDEAGDAPVLGLGADVAVDEGGRDLRHADLARVGLEKRANQRFITQAPPVPAETVDGHVHGSPLSSCPAIAGDGPASASGGETGLLPIDPPSKARHPPLAGK